MIKTSHPIVRWLAMYDYCPLWVYNQKVKILIFYLQAVLFSPDRVLNPVRASRFNYFTAWAILNKSSLLGIIVRLAKSHFHLLSML